MVKDYMKKQVVIQAIQFLGNPEEIKEFMGTTGHHYDELDLIIPTLEGDLRAVEGDYIIKGIKGEFYPCKPDIFEMTYNDISVEAIEPADDHWKKNRDFGIALHWLKGGKKVARKGWNGKNMFVVYQKGYPDGIPCNKNTAEAWGMQEGDLFKCEPYLQIKMVNGSHAMWVPSINDVLSNDWELVE